MSIIISNVSDYKGKEYSRKGLQYYEVRLNNILLSEFTHVSEEGMAVCLEKAAKSLEGVDIDQCISDHTKRQLMKLTEYVGEDN